VSRAAVALALALVALVAATPADARSPRAVLAFLPAGGDDNPAPVLDRLQAREQFALGLMSATQSRYRPQQMILDISAGSRTSATVYDPNEAPELGLVPGGDGSGFVFGWSQALKQRADAVDERHRWPQ